jgi:nitrogen-specific signal transduction histidine kinase/CheY-like chemotaxis protein
VTRDAESAKSPIFPVRSIILIGMVPKKGVDEETTRLMQEDRVATLGALAAGVGHQINNPLTFMITNVALLQDMLSKTSPAAWTPEVVAELRARIAEIGEGAQRIARVVQDLRLFAHGDPSTNDAVDLRRVCEAALGMASNRLHQVARVRVELDDLPPVPGNEGTLGQIVYNLLVNAARAIEEGGTGRNEIVLRNGVEGTNVFVEVRDTGCGIAPDDLPRVFEPFFSTKRAGEGAGLGLAMSRRIVSALGGSIGVRSQLGLGSTFRLTLPLRPVTRVMRRPSQPRTPELPRLRILVIDDDPIVGKSFERLLGEEHDVVAVTSGREALARIERESFDVVMTDLMMPEMSGMELYRAIVERHASLAERVLFLTGGAFTERAEKFVRSVRDRCLHKPVSMGRVRAALLDLLKRNAH